MVNERTTRIVLSAKAKNNFAQLIDDVHTHHTRYIIQRFGTPRAALIPLTDLQRLLALEGQGIAALHESRAAYQLGEERTPEEVADLVGRDHAVKG
jgi:prevent-host-death family protein